MPEVRIFTTSEFEFQFSNYADFFSLIRGAVAETLEVETSGVCVSHQDYAPGCEEGRPAVTVFVSAIKTDELEAKHELLGRELVCAVEQIASNAIGAPAGLVRVSIALGECKVFQVGRGKDE